MGLNKKKSQIKFFIRLNILNIKITKQNLKKTNKIKFFLVKKT